MRKQFIIFILVLLAGFFSEAVAFPRLFPFSAPVKDFSENYETPEYRVNFQPHYPLVIGSGTKIYLATLLNAEKVTLYSEREQEIPMYYYKESGVWIGLFEVPGDYEEGWHYFIVWIRYHEDGRIKRLSRKMWVRAFKGKAEKEKLGLSYLGEREVISKPLIEREIVRIATEEVPVTVYPTMEAVGTSEASLVLKGNKTLSFSNKSIEGSKEGFSPGITREESLRLNIGGDVLDTQVEANLFSTSAMGTSAIAQKEDKVSVKIRRQNLEGYLGDFTAEMKETEFGSLNKVLTGLRLKGDYEKWGFDMLGGSPQGQSKQDRMYGDGTQGPYNLSFSPVVIDSERVYVDGSRQKRGDDYEIDYQAGTVTFKNQVINALSIIQIAYDYRETTYQHSTYAFRATTRPFSNLKLGATYLNDSDSRQNAAEIRSTMQNPVNPQSHYVAALDGALFAGTNFSANAEAAYSEKDLDILTATSTKEIGKAVKVDASGSFGPFGLETKFKRVGAKFQKIADADPKQNVTQFSGLLSFRPNNILMSKLYYGNDDYTQSKVDYKNLNRTFKLALTPDERPSLQYDYYDLEDSNDPVTGAHIQRKITRNSAETVYKKGYLTTSVRGALEERLNRSPSEEATFYKTINFGLSSQGLEKVSFATNLELKDTVLPDKTQPFTRTYDLKLSLNPNPSYFVSTSLQIVEDTIDGTTNVTDLSFKADPVKTIKLSGKYTINSLLEEFGLLQEAVAKESGSFALDVRPTPVLRMRYLYKPNFTRLSRTGWRTYNNDQNQAEVNLTPLSQMLLGLLYKTGRSFSVDKSDFPNYSRIKESSDSNSLLYTVKIAPIQIMSLELNHLTEDSLGKTLISTVEPASYQATNGINRKFEATLKTSLTQKVSIDTSYTWQKQGQGTGEAFTNSIDTLTQTGKIKVIWNLTDNWAISASTSYSETYNYLSSTSPETYTLSPGVGFIFRLGDRVRVDFDYIYAKSHAGVNTEVRNYNLRAKYDLSDYVHLTLRVQQEHSQEPFYRLSDVVGNIEINL